MQKPDKKQSIAIAMVLIVTALLAALILTQGRATPGGEEAGHGEHAEEESHEGPGHGEPDEHDEKPAAAYKRGPHGGKLFEQGGYGVELTIYEQDAEPEFRVYTYQDAKPLDPAASRVDVTVERLGRAPQRFTFRKEGAYLKGDAVV
ncbi:efflux transporter periplasmic adaptor subunit, partial [Massilia cavernae]